MNDVKNYESPALEVMEIETECAILTASGEYSNPVDGE